MKERAIRLYDHEVRAVLAGRQTQLRRVVKFQPGPEAEIVPFEDRFACNGLMADIPEKLRRSFYCPLGVKGDRLWVQEAWGPRIDEDGKPDERQQYVKYRADNSSDVSPHDDMDWHTWEDHWRSSTQMPRWASRITLEIVSVRVERLQEISREDAIAEGTSRSMRDPGSSGQWLWEPVVGKVACPSGTASGPVECFQVAWQSINGPGSWDANPWVWCIDFRRVNDE